MEVLIEREKANGSFKDHAKTSEPVKEYLRDMQVRPLSNSQQAALDMIVHKIARITAGDPNVQDHWVDIAGYATLVAQQLDG
jgi:hypothetical protein